MERSNDGCPVVPRHADALLVMSEVVEIKFKHILLRADHPTQNIRKFGFAIRCEAHDLILIAVMRETKIHRQRGIEVT